MHGGTSRGAPEGNRNAWKHGVYSAEEILRRREVSEMARLMKRLARELD